MGVEAGRIAALLDHAGVKDLVVLLHAQDERLLVVLVPDTQYLNLLRGAAAVQIGFAAADDLRADRLEAIERQAVIRDLRGDGVLNGQFDGGERFIDRLLRLRFDRLHRGRVGLHGGHILIRHDADGHSDHLCRVARRGVAEIRDVHAQLRRKLGNSDRPAVCAGRHQSLGQLDGDGGRRSVGEAARLGRDHQHIAAGRKNIRGKRRDANRLRGGLFRFILILHGRRVGGAAAQQHQNQRRQNDRKLFHISSSWLRRLPGNGTAGLRPLFVCCFPSVTIIAD